MADRLHLLGMTQLIFELPLVGNVFGECEQVFGRAGLVGDRQFFRPHQPLAELARIERAFVNLVRLVRRQRAFVLQLDQIGVLALRQIAYSLADQFGAVDAEQILAGTIEIDAPAGAGILHQQHGGKALDHDVEEGARALQLLLGLLPLGDLGLQRRVRALQFLGAFAHAPLQIAGAVRQLRPGGGQPVMQPAGLKQQRGQHETRGQQAVNAARIEAEIEASAVKDGAERHVEQPRRHDHHQPQIENAVRPPPYQDGERRQG